MIPPSWNSSVNSWVSNDSCGCTEVLRPSQTANHHLALSGTVFSRNIPSNWLNIPPHPLAFSKVKTFTVTSFPVCPNAWLAFKLLHCSAYCSVTWYTWRDASPWSVCVNWSPLLLLPPVFCLWLKPDGSMKSRFGLMCSGPRSFTQMCPVLLYVFILFSFFQMRLIPSRPQLPDQAIWTLGGIGLCVCVNVWSSFSAQFKINCSFWSL